MRLAGLRAFGRHGWRWLHCNRFLLTSWQPSAHAGKLEEAIQHFEQARRLYHPEDARQQLIAKSEAEIAKQAERLQTALTNMSQGLCLFDPDQRVVVANRRYAEIYGLRPDQLKPGTTLRDILSACLSA